MREEILNPRCTHIRKINHVTTYAFYTGNTMLNNYTVAFPVKGSFLEMVNMLTVNGCKCEQWNTKEPAHE